MTKGSEPARIHLLRFPTDSEFRHLRSFVRLRTVGQRRSSIDSELRVEISKSRRDTLAAQRRREIGAMALHEMPSNQELTRNVELRTACARRRRDRLAMAERLFRSLVAV